MKKFLLLFLAVVFMASCNKQKEVYLSGKINGGSPLERIELIDASGVATLPIANFGVDGQGNFSDTVTIAKSGIYAITYGGKMNFIYLKGGEKLNLNGNAYSFPQELTVGGDAKGNNQFLVQSQKFIEGYLSKLTQELLVQDESKFLAQMEKLRKDISAKIDEYGKSSGADNEVVKWKKNELDTNILMIMFQYEKMHGQLANKPDYKPSQKFLAMQKELDKDQKTLVREMPTYRNYLVNKLSDGFQQFATKNTDPQKSGSELFIEYIKPMDYPQEVKDYLVSFVATQLDLHPQAENKDRLMKVLDENIKDSKIKAELHKVADAMYGLKVGTAAPDSEMVDAGGKKATLSSLKGKPSLLIFYASWNPYIAESLMPAMTEITKFYKDGINFVFVNLDDNVGQFRKTSAAMLSDLPVKSFYAKGGLNSKMAKDYAIYGFKMPNFVFVDKDGKIASKSLFGINDPEFKQTLDKLSGKSMTATAPPAESVPPVAEAPAK